MRISTQVRAAIDWAAIEADYLAGSMSIRAMASYRQIDEKTIRSHAKANGWPAHQARHITDAEIVAAGGRPVSRHG